MSSRLFDDPDWRWRPPIKHYHDWNDFRPGVDGPGIREMPASPSPLGGDLAEMHDLEYHGRGLLFPERWQD